HSLADIVASVGQVADAVGESARGREAIAWLEGRLQRVRDDVADRPPPRVLMLEWLDPPFVPGHWVPEMLTQAEGVCLLGEPGQRSRQIGWDDAADLVPEFLLIEPCGYDRAQAEVDADRARHRLLETAPRAIATGNAWTVDSAHFSRSGPRVVDGV